MERNKKTINLHSVKFNPKKFNHLKWIFAIGLFICQLQNLNAKSHDNSPEANKSIIQKDSLKITENSNLKNNRIINYWMVDSIISTQSASLEPVPSKVETKSKAWYEKFSLGGYVQVRYNRLFETNPKLVCEQCDKSIGDNNGFFIRRNRLRVSGQVHPQVFMYIQYDFASAPSTTALHYGQLRDAYFDVGVDKDNEFRFRIGQSKVPYGFINMQSSQNRLNLDRDDGMNSGLANERDLGVFFYWAPKKKRELLDRVIKDGLKGSGDYGCFAYGVYNGQNANRPELNNNLYQVVRFTWPFEFKGQIFEPGVQAYKGDWTMQSVSSQTKVVKDLTYKEERLGGTLVMYPKPFGFQAEYNVGNGPRFNKITDSIEVSRLWGGYAMFNYQLKFKDKIFFPFVRYAYYNGGKKHELDARAYEVTEWEGGVEIQFNKNFELTLAYNLASRRFEDYKNQDNLQKGQFMRIQAQLNF